MRMAAILIPLALVGCSSVGGVPLGPPANSDDFRLEHRIGVRPEVRSLTLPATGGQLTAGDLQAVRALVSDHTRRGHGPIEIAGRALEVRTAVSALLAAGARSADLRPRIDASPGVRLSFPAYAAVAPECGKFESDSRPVGFLTPTNSQSSELGCTTQRNLALMASDPLDLVRSRGNAPDAPSAYGAGAVQDRRTFGQYEKPILR